MNTSSRNTIDLTVSYVTQNGTAVAGPDYVALTSATLTFPSGTTSRTITVPVNGDTLNEDDETFLVTLSSPTNATIADAQGQGAIADDDLPPAIAINDITVGDGQTGVVSATFSVSLSAASARSISVNYQTADGAAVAGADYTARSGTLTFLPGATSLTITILVKGDTLVEGNETFFVDLASPVNATIGDGRGVCTIVDGPSPAPRQYVYLPIVR